MRQKIIDRSFDLIEAFQERIYLYLKEQQCPEQAYKVLIYSLEHLDESKRLITTQNEKKSFIQAEKRTRDIVKQLKKRELSIVQRVSLVFIGISPCLTFHVGMKFRGLLERFL